MEIRKVFRIADSRAIILPKAFPNVRYVTVELRDDRLIIKPLKEVG